MPVVVISTSVDEPFDPAQGLHVMPNPTSGPITITFPSVNPGRDRSRDIVLCDAQGRVMWSERVRGASVTRSIEELPAGLYILREVGSIHAVRVVRE